MKTLSAIVYVSLWAASAAWAAPPAIDGPAEVPAGTPVIFTTIVEEGAAYKWQLLDSEAELKVFRVCPAEGQASELCLLPTTAAGVYRVQLIRATVDQETITAVIDVVTHSVQIGEPPPAPPTTPPVDVVESTVRDLAAAVGDKATAVQLGAVFHILAGQAHASTEALMTATDAAVTVTVKGKAAGWQSFLDGLETMLSTLAESGKLNTVADHQVVWAKIASGLTAAAK